MSKEYILLKIVKNSLSLSPLGHFSCFASCKALCALFSASLPPPPFPGERLCMLCWLCIVQSLWAYTPGVRAGLNVGLPPSPCLGLRPKQGRFGCLPKVLHDAKPSKQATPNPTHRKLYKLFDDLYFGVVFHDIKLCSD